jgi:hypothetical protein
VAITVPTSGGTATISTTEYSLVNASTSLAASTTVCMMQGWIDFANMVAGDGYRVRVYEKINAGTKRTIYDTTLTGVQPGPLVLPTLILGDGWDVTVLRTAGSDRTVLWSLRTVS